jgi:hypothetical protein
MKIRMTLSIGYPQASHEDEIEIDDGDVPAELDGDELIAWLHEYYWQEWAHGYIDGGVEIVEPRK